MFQYVSILTTMRMMLKDVYAIYISIYFLPHSVINGIPILVAISLNFSNV